MPKELERFHISAILHGFSLTTASDSDIVHPPEDVQAPPEAGTDVHYEGFFEFPDTGEDPFTRVSFLRANAVQLRESDITNNALRDLATLIGLLVREEGHHVQLYNDLKQAEETKKAVDLLRDNPASLPSTEFGLHEGSEGKLYLRVRKLSLCAPNHLHLRAAQKEVPYWIMDSEASLFVIVQDLMRDVLGLQLPASQLQPSDSGSLPIESGYDTTNPINAQFTFGNSLVTVKGTPVTKPGAAGAASHGAYNVTIGGGNRADPLISPEVPTVESADPVPQIPRFKLGDINVTQTSPSSDGPAAISALFRDFKLKLISDPEAKKHGAEAATNNFSLGVSRDFDDRINSISRDTPETGEVVLGGGFDPTNHPTSAITLQSTDMGIAFNGTKERSDYKLRIGPFLFDVVVSGGIPDFILRDVLI
ncbi:hypothetical protein Emag_005056 [Eimeria magna]